MKTLRSAFAAYVLAVGCGGEVVNAPPTDADDTAPIDAVGAEVDTPPPSRLTLDPSDAVLFVDDRTMPATSAVLVYKAICNNDDGTRTDVSASTTMTIDPPWVGAFAGPVLTTITDPTLLGPGVAATVSATSTACGATTVPVAIVNGVQGLFTVPYLGAPTPAKRAVSYVTYGGAVDVALVVDTSSTMSSAIADLQANCAGILVPKLPPIGKVPPALSVVRHEDFPYSAYGSSGCGDVPVAVAQVITSNATKWQNAFDALTIHCGGDGPDSQIPAMHHALTGSALTWPGGKVGVHSPPLGTFGGAEFPLHALNVVVAITDSDWHGEGHVPYSFPAPTMADLKVAFVAKNARFVQITSGTSEDQANDLSDATHSNVPSTSFGSVCPTGKCCTGVDGAERTPAGPSGTCRLNFLAESTGGVSKTLVRAISALVVGSRIDVTTVMSNDPTNPAGVDATKLLKSVRAMGEGSSLEACKPATTKDTDGDGIDDTFVSVAVGRNVCFEVLPRANTTIPAKTTPQFFRAYLDIVGQPGAISLDHRSINFLVPAKK